MQILIVKFPFTQSINDMKSFNTYTKPETHTKDSTTCIQWVVML